MFPPFLQAEELKRPVPISVEVVAPRVANPEPALGMAMPVSQLVYEPLIDLQSRNMPEAQSDVTIRGGTFETAGVMIDGVSGYDPQTGHYSMELPVAPDMLSAVKLLTGSESAIRAFAASSGAVAYGWKPILRNSARLALGAGDFETLSGHSYLAWRDLLKAPGNVSVNADLDVAGFHSQGSRADSDSRFRRLGSRLQILSPDSQTDIFVGHQNKNFKWPYLYALQELHDLVGSPGIEGERISTTLAVLNHHVRYAEASYIEAALGFRRNRDDYEFDVSRPGLFNAYVHRTDALQASLGGVHDNGSWGLDYQGRAVLEDLDSSALTYAPYSSRQQGQISFLPYVRRALSEAWDIKFGAGLGAFESSKSNPRLSPLALVELGTGRSSRRHIVFSSVSQVAQAPGFTALASNPSAGLFRGNADLGDLVSTTYEIGHRFEGQQLKTRLATFYRHDQDLTDWVYDSERKPFAARVAENVTLGTYGVEGTLQYHHDLGDLSLGYTFLHKNADYKDAAVDASFYALNFPVHRLSAGVQLRLGNFATLLLDNEYRYQEKNALRISAGRGYFISSGALRLEWPKFDGLRLVLAVDNIQNEHFEEVPGVPGAGRVAGARLEVEL
ncbi:MAG: TonB-dependent receptor [Oligoflexia bacterium]|nr:TonB-dependent receptor [Oligoflexia bacterium]